MAQRPETSASSRTRGSAVRNRKFEQALEAMPSPAGAPRSMSRAELAEAVNAELARRGLRGLLTEKDIGRYVRGETRWPQKRYRDALRAVLGVDSDYDLGFYPYRRRTDAGTDDRQTFSSTDVIEVGYESPALKRRGTGHVDTGWAGMLRRTVLAGPLALASAHLLECFTPTERDDKLDPELLQGLLATAKHYRRAYQAVPASQLLSAALAHLDVVMSLRPSWRVERERLPLLTVAGEMAALAGVLFGMDACQYQGAKTYLDFRALEQAFAVNLGVVLDS